MAQISEREEQVKGGHTIAEQEARLAELVAKEKDQLEKLAALTSMEQVQSQGLERLAETMKAQVGRSNKMALEEQEQKSRLERLDRLAEKRETWVRKVFSGGRRDWGIPSRAATGV